MSDTLREMSKECGGIEKAMSDAFSSRCEWNQKQREIEKSILPYIYAFLQPGRSNGIEKEQIEILLEHFCTVKYNEWTVRDALPLLLRNSKYPRVCHHYKFGYYLLKHGESEYGN